MPFCSFPDVPLFLVSEMDSAIIGYGLAKIVVIETEKCINSTLYAIFYSDAYFMNIENYDAEIAANCDF